MQVVRVRTIGMNDLGIMDADTQWLVMEGHWGGGGRREGID